MYLLRYQHNNDSCYLMHHGIEGQEWGTRNGPPYPLDPEDHSAAEKRANHGNYSQGVHPDRSDSNDYDDVYKITNKKGIDKKKLAKGAAITAGVLAAAGLTAGGIYLAKNPEVAKNALESIKDFKFNNLTSEGRELTKSLKESAKEAGLNKVDTKALIKSGRATNKANKLQDAANAASKVKDVVSRIADSSQKISEDDVKLIRNNRALNGQYGGSMMEAAAKRSGINLTKVDNNIRLENKRLAQAEEDRKATTGLGKVTSKINKVSSAYNQKILSPINNIAGTVNSTRNTVRNVVGAVGTVAGVTGMVANKKNKQNQQQNNQQNNQQYYDQRNNKQKNRR